MELGQRVKGIAKQARDCQSLEKSSAEASYLLLPQSLVQACPKEGVSQRGSWPLRQTLH